MCEPVDIDDSFSSNQVCATNVMLNIYHCLCITYGVFGYAFRFQMETYCATRDVVIRIEWTTTDIPMYLVSLNISIIDR